ncbi:L-seryl-tRNA(Sec) selenium transferase (plasmid) [Paracoccus versutus]|uniref:L-seryl-tRNA(Sec) selenium transferase n=1 Tax=Paracoccus versutus TaxID=34007 RepID=A0AAQ0KMI7_PARVE|nr:L-seryl-tRNA(Sec) selenium transferase [Paracoccus versutus]KGJ03488.1 selenocysteine synthase [Paracoccus versutus]REG46995.1 L-seryl-tRNA(Sec) selenium transferase [Paracoccus versutus]WEJ82232.1 L-seryl-tRNA(Sec) selenium transferase [Paracoccus versutus]
MQSKLSTLPPLHEIVQTPAGRACVEAHGHAASLACIRELLDEYRQHLLAGTAEAEDRESAARRVAGAALERLDSRSAPAMRRVLNMTGTVLHTNLGRALYAPRAVEAANRAMTGPLALEYDLDAGRRGQRDDAVQALVAEITGAEAACIVNNNAAAILLVLAALAQGRETIVSRGELIEIGGSFRMPQIMESAGTRLREVGTTNRTHLRDYEGAIGPDTALLLKVHPSNYQVLGFTHETRCPDLLPVARRHGLPLVDDLGSGTLVDLSRWGLPHERSVQDALAEGVDLVTFSGDKLLGGPQAGFIAGRRDLVERCAKHPLKRALRLDKVRLAALEATLALYRDPDRLADRLPTLRHLARRPDEMQAMAQAILPALAAALPAGHAPEIAASQAQIGSGALPLEKLPSLALRIPAPGASAERIARALRRLPLPVIGRIAEGAVWLDLRCLDDPQPLVEQLPGLAALLAEPTLTKELP